jgi:hypothetical protein
MKLVTLILAFLLLIVPMTITAADGSDPGCAVSPTTRTGVTAAAPDRIAVGSDGRTVEQRNIVERLKMDNVPGSIKHLYVISAYSGQVLIYSTVRGKVTSSGKRLTPTSGRPYGGGGTGFVIDAIVTEEVLQDDGTYGSSIEYIYWWDSKGVYHQHYPETGAMIHLSDQPMAVKSITLNLETRQAN